MMIFIHYDTSSPPQHIGDTDGNDTCDKLLKDAHKAGWTRIKHIVRTRKEDVPPVEYTHFDAFESDKALEAFRARINERAFETGVYIEEYSNTRQNAITHIYGWRFEREHTAMIRAEKLQLEAPKPNDTHYTTYRAIPIGYKWAVQRNMGNPIEPTA